MRLRQAQSPKLPHPDPLSSRVLRDPKVEGNKEHYVNTEDDLIGMGWAIFAFVIVIATLVFFIVWEVIH